MSGKGDSPRPFSVTPEEFAASHERIFGKRPARTPYVPPHLPDTAATEQHNAAQHSPAQG